MSFEYKKEFFDRTYTAREAYGRVWVYARKYKFRIFVGIVCGMLTAGTLVPLFQVIQPAMAKVSENERLHERLESLEGLLDQRGHRPHWRTSTIGWRASAAVSRA